MIFDRIDNFITALKFSRFCKNIHSETKLKHDDILEKANERIEFNDNEDLLIGGEIHEIGKQLRSNCFKSFSQKYEGHEELFRIVIHTPPKEISPGGYSLFTNLSESLNFIGVDCQIITWGENFEELYLSFRPTHLLSSDSSNYLDKLDWNFINNKRRDDKLQVGLTASIEAYGNSPLEPRLKWGKNHVDFYYSFRSHEYLHSRADYQLFFKSGFKILSVEFGANPLYYFPVVSEKILDYTFLASGNRDKQKRYFEYLPYIFRNYKGLIDGPGWDFCKSWSDKDLHRYLYSFAKLGINLHIDDSIEWASELNERTYILAACGIPQLIDSAKLLPFRFDSNSMFVANNPEEYNSLFRFMLENPIECEKRALKALNEVYEKHTTFHRAESLLLQLKKLRYNEN